MIGNVIALGAAILVGLTGLWIAALQKVPVPVEARWIDGMYKRKEEAAANTRGPKVVLIGGSGTHYTLRAQLIAEQSGLAVVNLGTHAGLGGEYILFRARHSLKRGDTAVLALEHQLLRPSSPSSLLSMFVMTTDPRYVIAAPNRDVPQLLFGYSPVQMVRQTSVAILPHVSPLNRGDSVTSFGDESANTPENRQPAMVAIVNSLPPFPLTKSSVLDAPPKYLLEFVEWAKQNNIRLLQAWPTTTFRPIYLTPRYRQYFEQYAETFHRLGIKTLGSPPSYFLPEAEMFDSMYHADSNGAAKVSATLAMDLCHAIDCPQSPAQ